MGFQKFLMITKNLNKSVRGTKKDLTKFRKKRVKAKNKI